MSTTFTATVPSVTVVEPARTRTRINENRNDSLDSLVDRIMGLDREDYAVPANQLRVRLDSENPHVGPEFVAGQFAWDATPYAVDQVSDRLSKGLRSFGNELDSRGHHALRVQIIDDMLRLEPDDRKFQVRTINPHGERMARAVVSDRYKPIDDNVLVQPMLELIAERANEWRALGGQITDKHTRIRFMSREPQVWDIGPNKRNWHVGFQYQNSEVGASAQSFSIFVFDSFCENGCIFGTRELLGAKFRHTGSAITSDFGLVSEQRLRQLELATIQQSIVDATRMVLNHDAGAHIREIVEQSTARRLEGPATQQIEQIKALSEWAGLSRTQAETVVARWDSREANAFGVSSAVTRLAQDAGDYESRVKLEEAGGKLLEMPARQWKSIMALAT